MNLEMLSNDCFESVKNDNNHCLSAQWKRRLWEALGPVSYDVNGYAMTTIGLRRRVLLAKLAVEEVLPIWQRSFPTNRLPMRMLSYADQVLSNSIDRSNAVGIYQEGWVMADNAAAGTCDVEEMGDPASLVGYSACRLLSVSIYDEALFELTDDESNDPYLYDPAEYAAAAAAGGFPKDLDSDRQMRLDFWKKYLFEFYPQIIA